MDPDPAFSRSFFMNIGSQGRWLWHLQQTGRECLPPQMTVLQTYEAQPCGWLEAGLSLATQGWVAGHAGRGTLGRIQQLFLGSIKICKAGRNQLHSVFAIQEYRIKCNSSPKIL
jgi:hypothetical protein